MKTHEKLFRRNSLNIDLPKLMAHLHQKLGLLHCHETHFKKNVIKYSRSNFVKRSFKKNVKCTELLETHCHEPELALEGRLLSEPIIISDNLFLLTSSSFSTDLSKGLIPTD